MGHNPLPTKRWPTRLELVRREYLADRIDAGELERRIAILIENGLEDERPGPPAPPKRADAAQARPPILDR